MYEVFENMYRNIICVCVCVYMCLYMYGHMGVCSAIYVYVATCIFVPALGVA